MVGIQTAATFTIAMFGLKLYIDKDMGITAYGVRKDNLIIGRNHLEISGVTIPYAELTNLVIYVEEYLGMPKEIYGIHHGGNNKIQFDHKGRTVSINYVIKNKEDYERVSLLVDQIEKDPNLKRYLKNLD